MCAKGRTGGRNGNDEFGDCTEISAEVSEFSGDFLMVARDRAQGPETRNVKNVPRDRQPGAGNPENSRKERKKRREYMECPH